MDYLWQQPEVQISLPSLESDDNLHVDVKWTAKQLSHLYLIAYHANEYNTCDLIADTWIRALQKANAKPNYNLWKANQAKNYKPLTEKDYIDIDDPELDKSVTRFDRDRLNELYSHTDKDCGARFLWADAMALCGSRIEADMERTGNVKADWHKDLVWNIMCTSLRLTRARLTLKIEEKTKGAWCSRYHEHEKHQKPCYRAVYEEQERWKNESGARSFPCRGDSIQPIGLIHHHDPEGIEEINCGAKGNQMVSEKLPHHHAQVKQVSFATDGTDSEHSEEE